MITANELRRGNLVYTYDTDYPYGPGNQFLFRVKDIGVCLYDENSSAGYDEVEPIPLTPEILETCGAKKNYFNNPEFDLGLNSCIDLVYEDGLIKISANNGEYKSETNITYLHQLQNLYFALTGEELKVEL